MRKLLFISLLVLLSTMSVRAQETLLVISDSVSIDTLSPDPEWYVAPIIPSSSRAPMRSNAAASCNTDSVLNFNIDSVLVGITFYTYDESDRAINTTGWSCLSDGSRIGWQKCDYAYSGNYQTLRAIYDWDYELNTWKGVEKEEYVYEGDKMISHTTYDWLDGDWSANMKYTYEYDEAGREIQYIYYSRNSTTLQLEPYRGRFRIWDDNSRMIEDIQYSAHNGTTWSAGTKANLAYDAQGNQIEYTYCSSYSNGNWINSTHENWTYNASKLKTYYRKQTWSSNKWITSNEEFYNYNAAGKYLLVEKYALKSGVLAGSSKQTYEYNASNLETGSISYKWSNNTWVNNSWTVTGYDAANNKTETCKYTWKNNKWTGTGSRVLKTFNAKKKVIDQITQTWPTNATNWVNSSRITAEYTTNSLKTQEISYTWQNNNWVGTTRIDWHFNTAGKNDTITTFVMSGANWTNSTRTIYTYDAKGNTNITKYTDWNGSKWVMVSMTRDDYLYAGSALLSKSSWECGEDSIWSGTQKDSTAYSSTGKTIFTAHYTWENGDWTMQNKVETSYDSADRQTIQERFEMVGGFMTGKSRSEKEYDAQGNMLVDASFNNWNSATNTWIGYRKQERAYENGKVTSLTMYNWVSNDWLPNLRFSYSYDAQGNEIMQMTEQYSNGNWTNLSKSEHEYKGDMMIKENTFQWLNNQWVYTSREETYYDDDVDAKQRRHITGTWEDGVLTSFADFHIVYTCDPAVIRFVNYDGSILETQTLEKGVTPVYNGTTPTRDGGPDNTYTFAGWMPEIVPVTGNATYTATFTTTTNNYTITWLNDDGTQIDQTTLPYGAMPTHEDASKVNTAEYTYAFNGWTPGLGIVTGDATYTATFDSIKRSYTINWLNSDDSPLGTTTVEYGIMPTHDAPTKVSTAEYDYTFAGWTPTITAVTSDATYTANFDSIKRNYTVTWLNSDNSPLGTTTVEYGVVPVHEDPKKVNTAEYDYTFAGWSPTITAVTGDATYTATFDSIKRSYTVTWLNSDNSPLGTTTVEYGIVPVHEDPTKVSTAEYDYTFAGWSPTITPVTGDATYTATFDSIKNSYTITWLNSDNSPLYQSTVEYGVVPVHEDPTKVSTAEYDYTFAGWSPTITAVTGDATYTATFDSIKRSYTVTWLNSDNSPLGTTTVEYGVVPVHEDPTKVSTAEYDYTFAGWTPTITSVTGDATYTATFDSKKRSYTITWLNSDNSPLYQSTVEYGVVPVHEDPTKVSTAEYDYSFAGWTPTITAVTGDATYTATFDSKKRSYTITWLNPDNSPLSQSTVEYGVVPVHDAPTKVSTAEYDYTFAGWKPSLTAVTGDATYTATFDSIKRSYTVTWLNSDNSPLSQSTVEYGATPFHDAPTKVSTAEYDYTFAGWTPTITSVIGDATYTATFDSIKRSYTITWLNSDNSPLSQSTVEYGVIPTHADVTRPDANGYHYTFSGWTPTITSVTGNATYKATYDSILTKCIITFYFENGETILDQVEVAYGEIPSTDLIPSKNSEEHYYYTFDGWYPEIVPATGNASYVATYKAIPQQYTITFKNYNGWELEKTTAGYGTIPVYTGETPTKPKDKHYTYVFAGWSPELTEVSSPATYTAVFEGIVNQYTIIFLDADGTELDRQEVDYGSIPTPAVIPTKEDDEQYTYTFAGWNPKLTTVTRDATYKATYSKRSKTQGLGEVPSDQVPSTKVLRNGHIYILRGGKTYTLDGIEIKEQ